MSILGARKHIFIYIYIVAGLLLSYKLAKGYGKGATQDPTVMLDLASDTGPCGTRLAVLMLGLTVIQAQIVMLQDLTVMQDPIVMLDLTVMLDPIGRLVSTIYIGMSPVAHVSDIGILPIMFRGFLFRILERKSILT